MAEEQPVPAQEEPQKGGSYVRNPDGTLTRVGVPEEEAEEQPQQ